MGRAPKVEEANADEASVLEELEDDEQGQGENAFVPYHEWKNSVRETTGAGRGLKGGDAARLARSEWEEFIQARKDRHMAPWNVTDTFKLRGNLGDAMAEQPRGFLLPLRDEQRRSLGWMRAREAKKQGLRGGILADKMGYGKTCTAIGLIA